MHLGVVGLGWAGSQDGDAERVTIRLESDFELRGVMTVVGSQEATIAQNLALGGILEASEQGPTGGSNRPSEKRKSFPR